MNKMSRREIKRDAKDALRGNWGMAIASFVLFALIYCILNWLVTMPFQNEINEVAVLNAQGVDASLPFGASVAIMLLSIVVTAVISPIIIGLYGIYLAIVRRRAVGINTMFAYINRFPKMFGLMIVVYIKTLLWSLLFIIPGIVAMLNYSMSFFIMAENPEIGIMEAIDQSKALMKGNKGRLFVQQLSFIGWYILSSLTFGVLLLLFVGPYMFASEARFYEAVLEEKNPVVGGGMGGYTNEFNQNSIGDGFNTVDE